MPYNKKKQKCKQSDGDSGAYVLSYTDKKGKKHNNCHTSKKKMQGQIAAIEAEADMTDKEVLEETIRNLAKEVLLQEAGDRGFAYEATLINALEAAGVDVTPAAGNNSSISDLGFNIDGIDIGAEVKLGHGDNLGAIRKDNFSSLTWDGNTFTGAPSSNSEMPDVVNALISSMNSSSKVKARFKELETSVIPFRPLPWDLKSSFGNDKGSENESGLYAIIRNKPERFPIPPGATPVKRKQIATPGDGVANIDQATVLQIMSGKSAPNGAPTSYVIVGSGPGSESTVAGQIYSLGSDPLKIDAPVYIPGNVGVDIRFAGAGSSKSSRRYSFNFKTKATSSANSGIPFSNTEELMTILKKPLEESIIRKYVSTLLREDLTGSDKADIKRMIKKEIEGPTNHREVDKAFKKNFNAELKKALGVSFFGIPGKINKFVIDEIQKEVMKNLDSKASKDVIIFVCKEVIKKLYRELSFSSPQIIDRINPKV